MMNNINQGPHLTGGGHGVLVGHGVFVGHGEEAIVMNSN